MTALVRHHLIPLLDKVGIDANAGLLMQRGLRVWQESDKSDKTDLIDLINSVKQSDLYQLAFDRWLLQTYQGDGVTDPNTQFASISAQIDGRLMTGLALGGTLETGVSTHHSYGMPMLAGSAVKGAVRAYAENLFSKKDVAGKVVLVKDKKGVVRSVIDDAMKPILDILFGSDEDAEQSNAGYLIWHDALWIPALNKKGEYSSGDEAKPFVGEMVTVHHQKYYGDKTGKVEALDMESPIPNQQLAVQGGFYFVIEGEAQWVKFAKQLLENMLQNSGMGAKGAAGYGYFELDDTLNECLKKHYKLINKPRVDPNDIFSRAKGSIPNYSETELYEAFAKSGRTKSFSEYELDKLNAEHCKGVVEIALEFHSEWINSNEWKESKKETIKQALTFITNNKS